MYSTLLVNHQLFNIVKLTLTVSVCNRGSDLRGKKRPKKSPKIVLPGVNFEKNSSHKEF